MSAGGSGGPEEEVLRVPDEERDRYARLRMIPGWRQEKLQEARAVVVGIGALGNEAAKNLALLGIGRMVLVDFDRVETSNLSRSVLFRARDRGRSKVEAAARALWDLNPDVRVETVMGSAVWDLGLGLFLDSQVVLGCVDNREARLAINRMCWKAGAPWVNGALQTLDGLVEVFVPPDGPCYECTLTEADHRLLSVRYSCPRLHAGNVHLGWVPTVPTTASVVAGLQVQEAVKLLHGHHDSAGRSFHISGETLECFTSTLPVREDCQSHGAPRDPVAPLRLNAHTATPQSLLAAHRRRSGQTGTVEFDREMVAGRWCPRCRKKDPWAGPRGHPRDSGPLCPLCGGSREETLLHSLDGGHPLSRRSLSSLGVPRYDGVVVQGPRGQRVRYLLMGDRGDKAKIGGAK